MGESATESVGVPLRPRLKPWYRLSTSDARAVLRYGGSVLEFEGAAAAQLLPHLLPLLDGSRTLDAIVGELGEPIRPAVEHALHLLAEQHLLVEPPPAGLDDDKLRTTELLAASDVYGRDSGVVAEGLARGRAVVLGSSAIAGRIAELLSVCARPPVRTGWDDDAAHDCDLAIVAPAAAEVPLVSEWNRAALEHATTWLQVLPFDGLIAAVGPVFVPYESPCHECYRLRRSANISPLADTAAGGYPSSPAFDAILAGLASVVALRRLAFTDGMSVGVVLAVEGPTALGCSRHVLYRVPRCPACSATAGRAVPSPWSGVTRVAA